METMLHFSNQELELWKSYNGRWFEIQEEIGKGFTAGRDYATRREFEHLTQYRMSWIVQKQKEMLWQKFDSITWNIE